MRSIVGIIVLVLLAVSVRAEVSDEVKVSDPKGSATLSLQVIFTYVQQLNKVTEYAMLQQITEVDKNQAMKLFNLDAEKTTFKALEDHITGKAKMADVIGALVSGDSNFTKPMTALEEFEKFEIHSSGGPELQLESLHPRFRKYTYLSSILPFYVLISVFGLVLYVNRKKYQNYERFQLTRVSKILFSFLVFRIIIDSLYVIYLLLRQYVERVRNSTFLAYSCLISDQFVNLLVFVACILMFVQGYLTLSLDRKLIFNKSTLWLSLLYFFSVTLIQIHIRISALLQLFDRKYHIKINDRELKLDTAIIIFAVALKLAIGIISFKIFKKNYNKHEKNARFLYSFVTIVVAYILSDYIKFPHFTDLEMFLEYLVGHFIDEGLASTYTFDVPVPEVFQVVATCCLIYIWSNKKFIAKDLEC